MFVFIVGMISWDYKRVSYMNYVKVIFQISFQMSTSAVYS